MCLVFILDSFQFVDLFSTHSLKQISSSGNQLHFMNLCEIIVEFHNQFASVCLFSHSSGSSGHDALPEAQTVQTQTLFNHTLILSYFL